MATVLREWGEDPHFRLHCNRGRIDIVKELVALQVGHSSRWRKTMGIAIVCRQELGLQPEIVLYGDANHEEILEHCTDLGVACQCYPETDGCLRSLLQDWGS